MTIRRKYFNSMILLSILFLCIFITGCTNQTNNGEENVPGFSKYENTDYNFKINYPDTWTKYENYLPNSIVTFMAQSGGLGVLNGSLTVTVGDSGSMSMDEIKNSHIENVSQIYTDFNLTSENSTTLSGFTAYKLIITYKQGIYSLKQMEIWTIVNTKLYFLTFIVLDENYDNYITTIDQMINSFQII